MEISVLIPVFNYHVSPLVSALHQQLKKETERYEILLIDDCSTLSSSYINMKIKHLDNVKYKVLTENIGRAAIRNELFKAAKYENCVCIDCDMMPSENEDYIAHYLAHFEENTLIVGGHFYQENKPENKKKQLHWLYGKNVESKTAKERNLSPYKSFMSSNFACKKSTFSILSFNENIKGYGHEDSLLAFSAKNNNIAIKHIDNALLHKGIDNAEVFLAKQKNAVKNLKKLYKEPTYKVFLRENSKLIRYAEKPLLPVFIKVFENVFLSNLKSKHPSLIYLQMMKIIWWHKN